MEHYGSITTPVSVPRLIVGAMLAAGVAVLIMAFTKYGLLAGLAVSVIPAALCILWVTLRNPAISMLGLFVVNYFIMTLTRYAYDLPFGMILDALIFYNFLIITLQALMRPIEWKRASSGLTVVAAIWMAYCILEIVNPESVSVAGWFSSVRSIAFYFFFIVVLTQLTMTEYKYLKYMLAVWSVLTLIAVGKACMQKFFGFNAAENYWLFVLGGRSTHIIHSGVRYFSFFSDAANFGGSMGLSMVVFSISALYYRNSWMKLYLLLVAAAACYGMLISGTRSALAVPFVGYSAFIMMSRNIKMIGAGVFLIIAALGVGQVSKVTVIFIAAFLVMVITIYQGVKGVDTTLIKAARVLGAKQKDIFFKITIPASTPFILVAARLGLSTSMTTLMASEIVGGDKGIGMMIQQANGYYQMDVMRMGSTLSAITI